MMNKAQVFAALAASQQQLDMKKKRLEETESLLRNVVERCRVSERDNIIDDIFDLKDDIAELEEEILEYQEDLDDLQNAEIRDYITDMDLLDGLI